MHVRTAILSALLAFLPTYVPVLAQHEDDIQLAIENGRIVTRGGVPGDRIFLVALGTDWPPSASSPGFDCLPETFGVPGAIGFRIHGPLREWTGLNFTSTFGGERVQMAISSLGAILTPTTDAVVDGFSVGISPDGEWHRHFEYTLTGSAIPDDGVYLMELTLFQMPESTDPAAESEPFWFVFSRNGSPTSIASAEAWVRGHLITPCPVDFTSDGVVDVADLFGFINAWLAKTSTADFNHDDIVDVADLFGYINGWLAKC